MDRRSGDRTGHAFSEFNTKRESNRARIFGVLHQTAVENVTRWSMLWHDMRSEESWALCNLIRFSCSEAGCHSCGCKSRQQRSPRGTVMWRRVMALLDQAEANTPNTLYTPIVPYTQDAPRYPGRCIEPIPSLFL
jgi:hypothetical protein